MYADDTQLYVETAVTEVHPAIIRLSNCVSDVKSWCASRRLQLNGAKTDLAWFGSHANMTKLANVDCSLSVGNVIVKPSKVVGNLGVLCDSELTLKQHISKVANSCHHHIHRQLVVLKQ
jgi:hypothetical protein